MKRLSVFILIYCFASCSSDKVPVEEAILGIWNIDRAMRNDRITNSMEGLYMDFQDASSFQSNLLGDTASFTCTLDGKVIRIDHHLIKEFDITELTDTSLRLETELQENELVLFFKR